MQTLSVVLATFNEEKNLSACLESVKDLADEIIVVDGGSKDKTIEIAKKYKAKVVITDNPAMFHTNKQKAIDLATKDWILQVDADERVSKELKEEIVTMLQNRDSSINGYWIPRKNWFLGRFLMKGGQYPDYTLRFYRKGKGRLPQKDVHEQAIVDGKTEYLSAPLIHMADKSFSRYLMRFNRYTNLLKDEIREKYSKKNPFIGIKYLLLLPTWWFLLTYVRHKGFMDSWQGFLFSLFSSFRFPVAYIKFLQQQ